MQKQRYELCSGQPLRGGKVVGKVRSNMQLLAWRTDTSMPCATVFRAGATLKWVYERTETLLKAF